MNTKDFKQIYDCETYGIKKEYKSLRKDIAMHFIWIAFEFITSISIIIYSAVSILRFQNIFVIPLICGIVLFIVMIRGILVFIKGVHTLRKMRERIKKYTKMENETRI